jgi:cephalosporin hydroxylase
MTPLQKEYRHRCAQVTDIRDQLPVLYAWACHAKRVIELGVRGGNSTSAFLAALERGGGELWSVDISVPGVPLWWHELPSWHLMVADDCDPRAVSFCPGEADVLFIDTSHYYDHTLAELRAYAPKVRAGGLILMHDSGPDWPDVAQALNAWCRETGNEWYDLTGWPGMGVVELPV